MRLTEENRTTLNSFIVRAGFTAIAENRGVLNSFLVRAGFTTIAENFGVDVNQANTYGVTPLYDCSTTRSTRCSKAITR